MLNRRILRSRVMQTVFGYKQSESAVFQMALDQIDANLQTPIHQQDPQRLTGLVKLGHLFFEENYLLNPVLPGDTPEPVYQAAVKAIAFYRNQIKKEGETFRKQMLADTDRIYDTYLAVLLLLPELGKMAQQAASERLLKPEVATQKPESALADNRVLKAFVESSLLHQHSAKRVVNWEKEQAVVRKFYREEVGKDPDFQQYLQTEQPDFEQDLSLADGLVRKIFKDENLKVYFEDRDLHWDENQDIVKSMVRKTLKTIQADGTPELSELSKAWEEDQDFFKRLYDSTLEEDPKQAAYIAGKIQNWDVERVALTDKVILTMALAEMIHFPSIPVKVSINEYIELAKSFSTPKSKQFVNGVLDVMSQELIAAKVIRKSGRGLLDNK
jgi:transcription antitermination protein NusB